MQKIAWTKGHWFGVLAFSLWGFFPLYWKLFSNINAQSLTAWRILFTLIALSCMVTFKHEWLVLFRYLKHQGHIGRMLLANIAITSNWFIFIWAVQNDLTWETSLGYYMSPLITICLGAFLLQEKIHPLVKLASLLAGMGLLQFVWITHSLPWVSISLALTFSMYGMLKKKIALAAHLSLMFEGLTLAPLNIIFLAFFSPTPMAEISNLSMVLLMLSGPLTIAPLYFYNRSAQLIPLNNLGMLQYISPTLQFCTAFFIFHEPMTTDKLMAFLCIWLGLITYLMGPIIFAFIKQRRVVVKK